MSRTHWRYALVLSRRVSTAAATATAAATPVATIPPAPTQAVATIPMLECHRAAKRTAESPSRSTEKSSRVIRAPVSQRSIAPSSLMRGSRKSRAEGSVSGRARLVSPAPCLCRVVVALGVLPWIAIGQDFRAHGALRLRQRFRELPLPTETCPPSSRDGARTGCSTLSDLRDGNVDRHATRNMLPGDSPGERDVTEHHLVGEVPIALEILETLPRPRSSSGASESERTDEHDAESFPCSGTLPRGALQYCAVLDDKTLHDAGKMHIRPVRSTAPKLMTDVECAPRRQWISKRVTVFELIQRLLRPNHPRGRRAGVPERSPHQRALFAGRLFSSRLLSASCWWRLPPSRHDSSH